MAGVKIVADRESPDWEPRDVRLDVYVTRTFALALERLAADIGLSKSLMMRESVRRGFPALVNDVRWLERHGYRPDSHLEQVAVAAAVRGSQREGDVSARWSKTPDGRGRASGVPSRKGDSD